MKVLFYLHGISITDIKDDYPSQMEIPDRFFPIAQADITECSTYVVVCRPKSSPTYTVTSSSGSFGQPNCTGATVTDPENDVAFKAKSPLKLKVGVFAYVVVIYLPPSQCRQNQYQFFRFNLYKCTIYFWGQNNLII